MRASGELFVRRTSEVRPKFRTRRRRRPNAAAAVSRASPATPRRGRRRSFASPSPLPRELRAEETVHRRPVRCRRGYFFRRVPRGFVFARVVAGRFRSVDAFFAAAWSAWTRVFVFSRAGLEVGADAPDDVGSGFPARAVAVATPARRSDSSARSDRRASRSNEAAAAAAASASLGSSRRARRRGAWACADALAGSRSRRGSTRTASGRPRRGDARGRRRRQTRGTPRGRFGVVAGASTPARARRRARRRPRGRGGATQNAHVRRTASPSAPAMALTTGRRAGGDEGARIGAPSERGRPWRARSDDATGEARRASRFGVTRSI